MQQNWKKLYLKQKHAVCKVFNKDKLTQSKLLFGNLNAFNVYRINTYQQLKFMHKFINNQILSIFSDIIKRNDHKYPTKFSLSSCFLKGIHWIVQNVLFISVELNYGMMLLIKKRKIVNLVLFFKKIKLKLTEIVNKLRLILTKP